MANLLLATIEFEPRVMTVFFPMPIHQSYKHNIITISNIFSGGYNLSEIAILKF